MTDDSTTFYTTTKRALVSILDLLGDLPLRKSGNRPSSVPSKCKEFTSATNQHQATSIQDVSLTVKYSET